MRRNIGWVLAGAGVAALAAGGVFIGLAATADCNPECYERLIVPYNNTGIGVLAAGGAMAATGLILSVLGQGVMDDVFWRLRLRGHLSFVPVFGGTTAGVRLRF